MIRERVIRMRARSKNKTDSEVNDNIDKLISDKMEKIDVLQSALKKLLDGIKKDTDSK